MNTGDTEPYTLFVFAVRQLDFVSRFKGFPISFFPVLSSALHSSDLFAALR